MGRGIVCERCGPKPMGNPLALLAGLVVPILIKFLVVASLPVAAKSVTIQVAIAYGRIQTTEVLKRPQPFFADARIFSSIIDPGLQGIMTGKIPLDTELERIVDAAEAKLREAK